jgi:hypothetical protein
VENIIERFQCVKAGTYEVFFPKPDLEKKSVITRRYKKYTQSTTPTTTAII